MSPAPQTSHVGAVEPDNGQPAGDPAMMAFARPLNIGAVGPNDRQPAGAPDIMAFEFYERDPRSID